VSQSLGTQTLTGKIAPETMGVGHESKSVPQTAWGAKDRVKGIISKIIDFLKSLRAEFSSVGPGFDESLVAEE